MALTAVLVDLQSGTVKKRDIPARLTGQDRLLVATSATHVYFADSEGTTTPSSVRRYPVDGQ